MDEKEVKYQRALKLMNKKPNEAKLIFKELGNYKDSRAKENSCTRSTKNNYISLIITVSSIVIIIVLLIILL